MSNWQSAGEIIDDMTANGFLAEPRLTFLERSADQIGKPWTAEMHDALIHHIAEIERSYQELIRRREAERDPIRGRDLEERS